MLRNFSKLLSNNYRFATEVQKASSSSSSGAGLTYYKDGQITTRNALVLKKTEDIEAYVIKTVQNYFRTTYKNGTSKII
jgi:hypothetical protein